MNNKEYLHNWYVANRERLLQAARERYKKNRENILSRHKEKQATDSVFKAKRSKRAKEARQPRVNFLKQYKATHPCIVCGESDPIVLEFDHRDPSQKLFGISTSTGKRTLEAIKAEVAKCDVLCANCHRRKTNVDRQEKKFRPTPRHTWTYNTPAGSSSPTPQFASRSSDAAGICYAPWSISSQSNAGTGRGEAGTASCISGQAASA